MALESWELVYTTQIVVEYGDIAWTQNRAFREACRLFDARIVNAIDLLLEHKEWFATAMLCAPAIDALADAYQEHGYVAACEYRKALKRFFPEMYGQNEERRACYMESFGQVCRGTSAALALECFDNADIEVLVEKSVVASPTRKPIREVPVRIGEEPCLTQTRRSTLTFDPTRRA